MDNITDEQLDKSLDQLDKLLDRLLSRLQERAHSALNIGVVVENSKPVQHLAYYTRHGQIAVIESIDGAVACRYGRGYIIGDSGEHHARSWYKSIGTEMPYVMEADYPSGEDLFTEPPADPTSWPKSGNANAKERIA